MSLNKFTDTDIKEFMKIGASEINCTTLTAANIDFEEVVIEGLTLQGDALPQLEIAGSTPAGIANITMGPASESYIIMATEGNFLGGRIDSNDADDTFTIDPGTRPLVTINGGLSLLQTTVQPTPQANHISLYAKDTDDNIYKKDSFGNEVRMATLDNINSLTNVIYSLGSAVFVSASLTYVNATNFPVIPAGVLENGQVYTLTLSGELLTQTSPCTFQFTVFENGVDKSETGPTSSIPQSTTGSSNDIVFKISFFSKDSIPGSISYMITGNATVSDSTPQVKGLTTYTTRNIIYGVDNTFNIGVRTSNTDIGNASVTYSSSLVLQNPV